MLYLTGSSSGIGEACKVLASKSRKSFVALTHSDRSREAALENDSCAGAYTLNFRDVSQLSSELKRAFSEQEAPTALIHCAGKLVMKDATSSIEEDWDEVFDINAKASYFIMREFAESMRSNEGGTIVVIASIAGVAGLPNQSIYSASKAALIASAKSMAKEYFREGVKFFTVSPGPVSTQLFSDCLDWSANSIGEETDKVLDGWLANTLTKHPASPVSVAQIAFDAIESWPNEMVGCNLVLASGAN